MNLRTHDPIVWVGFAHPDPDMGRTSVRVLIPPAFWRRILHHLCVQDAAWGRWLTPHGVRQLRDVLECDAVPRNTMNPPAIPGRVMNVIQTTLRESFWRPLIVKIKTAGPDAGGYYLMILTSGATAVFRSNPVDPSTLLLEDCFFSSEHCDLPLANDDDMYWRSAVEKMLLRFAPFDCNQRRFHAGDNRIAKFLMPELWEFSAASWPSSVDRAESIGLSRLFDQTSPNSPATQLSIDQATATAIRLKHSIEGLTRRANQLPLHFHTSSEAFRQESCLDLIESRLKAWAAYVAIDEVYCSALESGTSCRGLSDQLDSVLSAIDALDAAMEFAEPYWLPVVAASELAGNWLTLLAPPRRQSPPWWIQTAAGKQVAC